MTEVESWFSQREGAGSRHFCIISDYPDCYISAEKKHKWKVEGKKLLMTLFEPLDQARPEAGSCLHFPVPWTMMFPFWVSSFKLDFCHLSQKLVPLKIRPDKLQSECGSSYCWKDKDVAVLGGDTEAEVGKATSSKTNPGGLTQKGKRLSRNWQVWGIALA